MIADPSPNILVGTPSPISSPTTTILVYYRLQFLFYLMSIRVLEIIQENFHYS